jgi:hypothetical protein
MTTIVFISHLIPKEITEEVHRASYLKFLNTILYLIASLDQQRQQFSPEQKQFICELALVFVNKSTGTSISLSMNPEQKLGEIGKWEVINPSSNEKEFILLILRETIEGIELNSSSFDVIAILMLIALRLKVSGIIFTRSAVYIFSNFLRKCPTIM